MEKDTNVSINLTLPELIEISTALLCKTGYISERMATAYTNEETKILQRNVAYVRELNRKIQTAIDEAAKQIKEKEIEKDGSKQ